MSGWLIVHLLGVVLVVGNAVTAAFWKIRADAQRVPAVIHSAARNVMLADYVFTLPGLVLLVVSGIVMAVRADWPMNGWNWLTVSIALFAITGILWAALLIPLQRAMIRHSAEAVASGRIPAAYDRVSRIWAIGGTAATLLPVVILYLMVAKL